MSMLDRVDGMVERESRRAAATQSRRGFLSHLGKLGAVVAGVSAIDAVAFAESAAAQHFCGHLGTTATPLCSNPSYCDAGTVAGGCWYGCCCTSSRLRQLCDCCISGSNSGYCPSGYKVKCIKIGCTNLGCNWRRDLSLFAWLVGSLAFLAGISGLYSP